MPQPPPRKKHAPKARPAFPPRPARGTAQPQAVLSDSPPPPAETQEPEDPRERLQKILAAAGLGSRRQCEELVLTGRVEVDRQIVSELGSKADPHRQEIRVDGVPLPRTKRVYYMVHKPSGVVSTSRDPSGRPRVIDMLPPGNERLFTVGRLDMSSEGLILVTNDGELANRLTHPRYGVEKIYHVEVAGVLEREDLDTMRKGVYLAEGFARVVRVAIKASYHKSTLLEIVLDEGRNREIRRLLARIGHKVQRLRRIALGPLRLGELPVGHSRPLAPNEIRELREASGEVVRKKRVRRRHSAVKKTASSDQDQPKPRPTVIGGEEPSRTQPRKRPFKPGAKAASKPGARSGAKPGNKLGSRPGGRPGSRPSAKPGAHAGPRGNPRGGRRTSGKPGSGRSA